MVGFSVFLNTMTSCREQYLDTDLIHEDVVGFVCVYMGGEGNGTGILPTTDSYLLMVNAGIDVFASANS